MSEPTSGRVFVTVRLDDLKRIIRASESNPYLFDDDGPYDFLDRLGAVVAGEEASDA